MFTKWPSSTRANVRKCGARFETLLRGPTQRCVEIFEGLHQGIMIEIAIGDVIKARPEKVTSDLTSKEFNGQGKP